MENVFVLPALDAEGKAKRVPDPYTGEALPATGAFKPRNQYWLRRIRAGDVTEGAPPAAPPAKAAEIARIPITAAAPAAIVHDDMLGAHGK